MKHGPPGSARTYSANNAQAIASISDDNPAGIQGAALSIAAPADTADPILGFSFFGIA